MEKKTFNIDIDIDIHYTMFERNMSYEKYKNKLKEELLRRAVNKNDGIEDQKNYVIKFYEKPYNEDEKESAIEYIAERLYQKDAPRRGLSIGGTGFPSAVETKEDYSLRMKVFLPYRNKAIEIYKRIQPFNLYLDMQECLDDERVLTFKIER